MTENGRIWAHDSIASLSQMLSTLSMTTEQVDIGVRGAALAVRTESDYYATILAAESEGPAVVVISTGVLRSVDPDKAWDALVAANAFGKTRAIGRLGVSEGRNGYTVTLHTAVVPQILLNVPEYTRAFLGAFAGQPRIARKFLASRGIRGDRFLWTSSSDVTDVLDTVDDETDLLLDFEELINGE